MTQSIRRLSILGAAAALALATTALAQMAAPDAMQDAATQELADGRSPAPTVGQRIDNGNLHRIRRPGLYGIGTTPDGSDYGVLGGRLIRYDPETMRVQSIIRQVDQILD